MNTQVTPNFPELTIKEYSNGNGTRRAYVECINRRKFIKAAQDAGQNVYTDHKIQGGAWRIDYGRRKNEAMK